MTAATFKIEVRPEARHAVLDLTDELRKAVKDSGVTDGCAVAFCAHTTSVLLINECYYAHDDLERRTQNLQEGHERANGRSHVSAMVLGGASHAIPVGAGEPLLGQWQRLLLLELDEPKERTVVFHVFGL